MTLKVCSSPGCPELVAKGRCTECEGKADRARGTATQRGYTSTGHKAFRAQVLARDPICVVCRKAKATVADHYPHSRRALVAMGANPNAPQYGRGLCHTCHSSETAEHQPGGWNISPDG